MPPQIRTLLLSGANNHEWRVTTPILKQMLEQSKKFDVEVTERPAEMLADEHGLDSWQLILSDYNGPDWGEPAKSNFLRAIGSGVGIAFLHASNNCFQGWEEYEKMLGYGWRNDVSGHGHFHELEVQIADRDHPVTKGLKHFRTKDELYHRLVNPHHVPLQVLARAYSDPETRGTGEMEPVMIAGHYGQGRVFQLMLGHVWSGDEPITLENPGFRQCLLRGCEWAATGDVTT